MFAKKRVPPANVHIPVQVIVCSGCGRVWPCRTAKMAAKMQAANARLWQAISDVRGKL